MLATDGVPCPRPVRWRGLCATHFQRLQKEHRVAEFALPSKRKYRFALKPDPDPALCRLIVNDEPCLMPAQRRGLCGRHYQGLWQRKDLDIQVWIEIGEKPLPRKIVFEYPLRNGSPQFTASITDWSLEAPKADLFVPKIPQGVGKVEFLPPGGGR